MKNFSVSCAKGSGLLLWLAFATGGVHPLSAWAVQRTVIASSDPVPVIRKRWTPPIQHVSRPISRPTTRAMLGPRVIPNVAKMTAQKRPELPTSKPTPASTPIVTSSPSKPAANMAGLAIPNFGKGDSLPWTIMVVLTLLAVIPALLLSMTPFVRLLVVFHFLRQALGTQNTPTNQTLIGLALFLTYFVMAPVGHAVYEQAVVPFQSGSVDAIQAMEIGAVPARKFMMRYAREKDLALFVDLAKEPAPRTPDDVPMRVIVPAYIVSELKAGFQIGMVLFLPFLVIDLVVASVTTSVGMLQLPPVVISTPLKVLLFVLVDGWNLVVGSLMKSFY